MTTTPDMTPTGALAAAETAFDRDDYESAAAHYRAVLAEGENLRARVRLGASLAALGAWAEAHSVLQPAISGTETPQPFFQLARAEAALGRPDEALTLLERAAELGFRQPDRVTADPVFAAVSHDDRFAGVVRRLERNAHPVADSAAHRALDFWIGEWVVRSADGAIRGHNSVSLDLGGAAIFESWTSVDGYRGRSVNCFNRAAGHWVQTWVDEEGDVLEFTGESIDGVLRFVDRAGPEWRRMTLAELGPNRLRQVIETSSDRGTTWEPEYDLLYFRVGSPQMGDEDVASDTSTEAN